MPILRREQDPLFWARGRLIAIRPDGARRSFDPEAIRAIRTDEEHAEAAVVMHALWERTAQRGGYPEWYEPEQEP
jgi:hypothetical protein